MIAVGTTLASFIAGTEVIGGHEPGYHVLGVELMVLVAIAVLGAFQGRGAPGPMLRWLSFLCVLQAAYCGWVLLSPAGTRGVGLAISAFPLAGYLLAIARVSAEIRATQVST
jgi:hypothetical protein